MHEPAPIRSQRICTPCAAWRERIGALEIAHDLGRVIDEMGERR